MDTPDELPPAQAALQAAISHVWTESYKKGHEQGWAAGWAAALSDLGISASSTDKSIARIPQDQPHNDIDDNLSEEEPQLELTEEWAKFFKSSEARRAANSHRKDTSMVTNAQPKAVLQLGGAAENARRRKARKLYGSQAESVLEMEAGLTASFEQVLHRENAVLWPVLSVREVEIGRGNG